MLEIRCYKYYLPDGKVVDILSEIILEMSKWIQNDLSKPESGGYILGYQHKKTNNVSLEFLTTPQINDNRTRISFSLRDITHKTILEKSKSRLSYYMGVWHTHPQRHPSPSQTDWSDWYSALETDRTASRYMFFIIAGTDSFRIWIGNYADKKIVEIYECDIQKGLYHNNGYHFDRMV